MNLARESVPGELWSIQIHRSDLLAIKVIGAGQMRKVYLALQSEKGVSERKNRAVKLYRKVSTIDDKDSFQGEAIIMLALSHRNLEALIGVSMQQKPWLMVVEYMKYGDLLTVLRTLNEKDTLLHSFEQIDWCLQISQGMQFLSAQHLVHMDLAARNCLLGENNQVKVSDFGLTRKIDQDQKHLILREMHKLPIKWLAIECFSTKMFSEASDVWAYGVTAWEIFRFVILSLAFHYIFCFTFSCLREIHDASF